MGGTVRLSWLEYDVLWEHLRLGPFRPVIAVPSPGHTLDERAELRAKAWVAISAKGLGGPGDVDERFAQSLTRLARPEWEVDARLQLSEQGPRTAALIARAGRGSTVAVLGDDELTVWDARSDRVVAEAVRLLPTHPTGTGNSINLPATALDQAASSAGSDPDRLWQALRTHGLDKSEARKITDVLAGAIRLGHFGAAHTPPGGPRRRGSHVISFYDNPSGRYLFTRKDGWVTLVPGSDAATARQLEELLATL